jgi:hypothetical protein
VAQTTRSGLNKDKAAQEGFRCSLRLEQGQTWPKQTLLVNVPSPKIHVQGESFIQGICRPLTSFDSRFQGRV